MLLVILLMAFNVIDSGHFYVLLPLITLVFSTLFILCYMMSAAIALNKYFAIHRDLLLGHIANLQEKRSEGELVDEGVINTLWVVVEKLNQDELLHPVKILGIKLDAVLFVKLIAVILLGFVALIKLTLS